MVPVVAPALAELMRSNVHVYVNGEVVPAAEAKISLFDRGFLYGDGVYEGLRLTREQRVFKLPQHLQRLRDSAKAICVKVPLTDEEIKKGLADIVRASGLQDAHMRVFVTRGISNPGLDPRHAAGATPTVVMMAYPFGSHMRAPDRGIRAKTAAVRRNSAECLDPKIKNLNYINEILAALEAVACGMDTALMLGVDGYVAEASGANVFLVRDGTLYTPYANQCLAGITRATVLEIAHENEIPAFEKDLTIAEVYTADEAFFVSTGVDVGSLVEVDGRPIGDGVTGKVTKRLQALFQERLKEESEPLL